MEKYNALLDLINSAKEEAEKFYTKENNAAGGRCRKIAQEIKKAAQAFRLDIQAVKASRKESK
jgi:hypothetical protein